LTGIGRGNEEEVIWEEWLVEVTIARPKTEGGELFCLKIRLQEAVLTRLPSPQKEKRYEERWKARYRRQL